MDEFIYDKRVVSSLKYTKDKEKHHKEIYLNFAQKLLTGSHDGQAANLPITTYAIRRILYPTFYWAQTEDLLDYLTHVDFLRGFAVGCAREALLWNRYYTEEAARAREDKSLDDAQRAHLDEAARRRLLSKEEARKVQAIADEKNDTSHREIYFQLVLDFVQLHVHHLWPLGSWQFASVVDDYFSPLTADPSHARRNFHRDIRDSELEGLERVEITCRKFVDKATEWADARLPNPGNNDEDEDEIPEAEFLAAFPPPIEVDELVRRCEDYLVIVQRMVEELESIFPNSG